MSVVWPTLFLEGHITKIPSFYVYLIDIELDGNRQRVVTVGLAHWLLGIYAEVEVTFRIYPECFEKPSELIYLPFVSFTCIDYKLEYVEQDNLTRVEVMTFVRTALQNVINWVEKNYLDTTNVEKIIRDFNSHYGIWLSTRLMQVLLYNQRLVKIVRDWMLSKCECVPDETQICYCSVWTRKELKTFNKIYFVDAERIVSNAVFFTTVGQEGC